MAADPHTSTKLGVTCQILYKRGGLGDCREESMKLQSLERVILEPPTLGGVV